MNQSRSLTILKNLISNYARYVTEITAFLIITPLIAAKFGTEGFGLWSLMMATVGLFRLMDLGFTNSVIKYVADARGRSAIDDVGRITATAFWIYATLSVLMMAIAILLLPWLPDLLKLPLKYVETACFIFFIMALRSAQALLLGMFTSILIASQKQYWMNLVKMLEWVCYCLLAIWNLLSFPSLEIQAFLYFITNFVANLIQMVLCMTKLEGIRITPWCISKKFLGEITSFSWFFFLIQVSGVLSMRANALIIQVFLTLPMVGFYAVAMRLAETASGFCRQLSNTLTPMIAELKGAGEESDIRTLFNQGTKLSVALAVPFLVGLFWFSEDLLRVWMGKEFVQATWSCRILVISVMINVLYSNPSNILAMTGHHRFLAHTVLVGQAINLTLSVILIQFLSIAGVALATLIANIISNGIMVQRRLEKLYFLSTFRFYYDIVGPSVIPCSFMLGAVWYLEQWLAPNSLLNIAMLETFACFTFGIAFILVGLEAEERRYYVQRVLKLFSLIFKKNKTVLVNK